jgi:tRNA1(Val) A37 N6-methylase TrmN6
MMTKKPQEIHVLNKRVRLLQPADGFRTSIDAILLAAACPAEAGQRILDLGCGVGTAGICLLWRVQGAQLNGIDIQAAHIELAQQNAALNGCADRAVFMAGDVAQRAQHQDGRKPVFDHVICNPPFLEDGTYLKAEHPERAIALGHQSHSNSIKGPHPFPLPEGEGDRPPPASGRRSGEGLQTWIDASYYQLKDGGVLTMIHRADHTDKIIQAFGRRFGATEIFPLWPHAGEAAKRVIIRTRKGRKTGAILYPGLVLHEADGSYTAAAEAVLRGGNAL